MTTAIEQLEQKYVAQRARLEEAERSAELAKIEAERTILAEQGLQREEDRIEAEREAFSAYVEQCKTTSAGLRGRMTALQDRIDAANAEVMEIQAEAHAVRGEISAGFTKFATETYRHQRSVGEPHPDGQHFARAKFNQWGLGPSTQLRLPTYLHLDVVQPTGHGGVLVVDRQGRPAG